VPPQELAQQDHTIEAERYAHVVDLGHETPYRPVGAIARAIRIAGIQLIVKDHRPHIGERGQRQEIVVREAGAAMDHQQRRLALGEVPAAVDPVPDPTARHRDVARVLRVGIGGVRDARQQAAEQAGSCDEARGPQQLAAIKGLHPCFPVSG
jgi:hypothetical protein